jgi:predicted metal-dependent enzyme (double-stranded beta helix superfamily)
MGGSFDLQRLVADCQRASREDNPALAIREVVGRAVSEPAALLQALGEPRRAEIQKLYHAPDLTVLNVIWAPRMVLMPHDHRMWAVIGIYSGREDNIFWRRIDEAEPGRIEAAGARALGTGEVASLGRHIIHSVTNPIPRLTAALHIYGGDFFAQTRSEWDPETLMERPFDVQKALRQFEEANAPLAGAQASGFSTKP